MDRPVQALTVTASIIADWVTNMSLNRTAPPGYGQSVHEADPLVDVLGYDDTAGCELLAR